MATGHITAAINLQCAVYVKPEVRNLIRTMTITTSSSAAKAMTSSSATMATMSSSVARASMPSTAAPATMFCFS